MNPNAAIVICTNILLLGILIASAKILRLGNFSVFGSGIKRIVYLLPQYNFMKSIVVKLKVFHQ